MKIAGDVHCHEETPNTKEGKSENQGEKAVKTYRATRFIDGCTYSQEGNQYCKSTNSD